MVVSRISYSLSPVANGARNILPLTPAGRVARVPRMSRATTSAENRPHAASIVALASIPFALKTVSFLWLPGNYAAQSLYKLGQLLVPVIWRSRVDGKRGWALLWPVDEPRPDKTTVLMAVGVALGSVIASIATISLFAAAMGVDPGAIREHLGARFSLNAATMIPAVMFLSTLNAGLEELHYRAWLDRELSARWGNVAGIAVSTALFSAIHLFIFADAPTATPTALACLFFALVVGGVAWSLIARRPGGIHAAWLAHGLTDALLLTWGLWWLGLISAT